MCTVHLLVTTGLTIHQSITLFIAIGKPASQSFIRVLCLPLRKGSESILDTMVVNLMRFLDSILVCVEKSEVKVLSDLLNRPEKHL